MYLKPAHGSARSLLHSPSSRYRSIFDFGRSHAEAPRPLTATAISVVCQALRSLLSALLPFHCPWRTRHSDRRSGEYSNDKDTQDNTRDSHLTTATALVPFAPLRHFILHPADRSIVRQHSFNVRPRIPKNRANPLAGGLHTRATQVWSSVMTAPNGHASHASRATV